MNLMAFVIVVVLIIAYQLMKRHSEPVTPLPSSKPDIAKIKVRLFMSNYTQQSLRARSDSLFLFGDNLDHAGTKGQAIIRYEPNAAGIVTKIKPSSSGDSYMSDDSYDDNCQHIDSSFDDVYRRLALRTSTGDLYTTIYLPRGGLGTGLAKLPEKAPKTFVYLMGKIYDLVEDLDPAQLDGVVGKWIQSFIS